MMTVDEYRKKHPNCEYCDNKISPFERCIATDKRMSKRTAKKCPCFVPKKWGWGYGTDKKDGAK